MSRLIRLLLYATLLAISAFGGLLAAALPELPRIEHSAQFHQRPGLVYARDGHTVLRRLLAPTSRHYVAERDVPAVLANAVVAAEDRRFYAHHGVDPRGLLRAAVVDVQARQYREGGSTLTQQLVKNAYVGPQQSLARKSREALLAIALDARWSKQRILTAYLNSVYFGDGAYGVRDAAQTYFATDVRRLDLPQAALLAALLRAPALDNPVVAPRRARAARARVLDTMLQLGMVTRGAHDAAVAAPLPSPRQVVQRRELAPHFADDVVGELVREYGTARVFGGGLRVTTTLDVGMQRAAVDAAHQIDGTGLSSAVVAIDPRSGELRALALGGPAADAAYDVATAGSRQPGSAFKPFALAAALQRGFTPQSRLRSAPYLGIDPSGMPYAVNNDGGYAGNISLASATWHSDNTAYARLAANIGPQAIVDAARAAGISSELLAYPSIVLGALPQGVGVVELASAYGSFATRGLHVGDDSGRPLRLRQVRDAGGRLLPLPGLPLPQGAVPANPQPVAQRAMPQLVADQVNATLQGVVRVGTGTRASIGRPVAGKTGTTDRNVDAWFVGYTPQLVAAVWVGHPEGAVPMQHEYHGKPVMGGTFPAEIWKAFAQAAFAHVPVMQFAAPHVEYVTLQVDAQTGLRADAWCAREVTRRFVKGTEPTRFTSICPDRTRPAPDLRGKTQADAVRLLQDSGMQFEVRDTVGDPAQVGTVIEQLPEPGAAVTRQSQIALFVVQPPPA